MSRLLLVCMFRDWWPWGACGQLLWAFMWSWGPCLVLLWGRITMLCLVSCRTGKNLIPDNTLSVIIFFQAMICSHYFQMHMHFPGHPGNLSWDRYTNPFLTSLLSLLAWLIQSGRSAKTPSMIAFSLISPISVWGMRLKLARRIVLQLSCKAFKIEWHYVLHQ